MAAHSPHFQSNPSAGTPECLSDGIACFYPDGSLTPRYLNPSLLAALGLSALPGSFQPCIAPEDLSGFQALLSALAPGQTRNTALRLTPLGGAPFWVRASCQLAGDSACLCHFIDIRYLKQDTMSYADKVPCGVFKILVDASLTLLYANAFFYKTYGYTRESAQAAGLVSCERIIEPRDFGRVHQEITTHIALGNYDFELENRGRTVENRSIWVLVRCQYNPEDNTLFGAVFDITDRKAAEEALRISEEENRIALSLADKYIGRYDLRTRTMIKNPEAAAVLGQTPVTRDVPESVIRSGLLARESVEDYRQFYKRMLDGQPKGSTSVRMRIPGKEGYTWFNADYSLVYGSSGEPITAIISFYDSTELREREVAYERWAKKYQRMRQDSIAYYEFNLTADVLETFEGQTRDSIPPDCHKSLEALTRFTAEHFIIPEDRKKYLRFFNRTRLLEQHRQGTNELSLEHRRFKPSGDGYFWGKAEVQLIVDPFEGTIRLFALIQDIDSAKRRALELRKLSQTDPLTGLYNRAAMIKRLSRVLRRGTAASHALIILDIDHFKELNDTCGHRFGDTVLQQVAQALSETLRSNDFSGRLGGDEFMIFMRGLSDPAIIQERLNIFRERIRGLHGPGLELTVSMGVAFFPVHGQSFQTLYEKADSALYEAKHRGRDGMVFCT
ncbi:sensor domain-containing diguanylate cyclase [Eubacterium sp. 1001713B170207_170306_E7]|uniref:sensor domain-containing diguanylate cyclase n=1 Tax=Eubacterium sp. 1001713B170207_170306_E7 TaxID=2787097 RepID=UPI00189AE5C8|nr:sensor domain-containing diguanylate cyclase [Eubacterium sp. 1001713B170207_170306_E7]